MTNRKHTKAGGANPPSRNRWKGLLATRLPDAVIEAFHRVADARGELPQKLQGQLRNLRAERPPLGRPRAKRSAAKPDRPRPR
jgi:hypothetical protein